MFEKFFFFFKKKVEKKKVMESEIERRAINFYRPNSISQATSNTIKIGHLEKGIRKSWVC